MANDDIVTIARFTDPFEAEMAKSRLESEGIRTFLIGGELNPFQGFIALEDTIQIRVPHEQAEKATRLMESVEAALRESRKAGDIDWSVVAHRVWVCALCGSTVREDLDTCPDCQTVRDEHIRSEEDLASRDEPNEAIRRDPDEIKPRVARVDPEFERVRERNESDPKPEPRPQPGEDDLNLPDLDTFLGDDIAGRALRSALLTPLLFPLMFYTCWLLWKLSGYPGKLSPKGRRSMFIALGLTFVYFVCFWFLFHLLKDAPWLVL